jgi:hypothetical protein
VLGFLFFTFTHCQIKKKKKKDGILSLPSYSCMSSIVAKLKSSVTGYEGEKVRNWGRERRCGGDKGKREKCYKKKNKALVPMFHIFTVEN